MPPDERPEIDYRFSLANERTFLSWIRTALALLAGEAPARWRRYEQAMRAGRPLPVGRGTAVVGLALAGYAILALIVAALDG